MKVKCKAKKLADLSPISDISLVQKNLEINEDKEYSLQKGQEYIVYGITFRKNHPWFYILEDDDEYPIPVPSIFFEIVDHRFSNFWCLFYSFTPYGPSTDILFQEWGKNENFYWDLVEGEEYAIKKFARMRLEMEKEFA